jgi:transcriptional regulator with XRE-family HTH domain
VKRLEHYFPAVREQHTHRAGSGFAVNPDGIMGESGHALDGVSTKWRTILSLEMQGLPKNQIAKHVGMTASAVSQITRDERYLAHREAYLETIDRDFLAMKPLAFKALQQGLTSSDEDTALKASDQWFRAAGFGGYSKRDEPATQTTAEDVVRQLLQINVQVNVGSDG